MKLCTECGGLMTVYSTGKAVGLRRVQHLKCKECSATCKVIQSRVGKIWLPLPLAGNRFIDIPPGAARLKVEPDGTVKFFGPMD